MNKLYISWLVLLAFVGIVGFCITTVMTLHDSYSAYKSFSNFKEVSTVDLDPNADSFSNLRTLENYLESPDVDKENVLDKLRYFGFSTFKYTDNSFSISLNTWGGTNTSNISNLFNAFLWILIPTGLIVLSYLAKKWLLWVFGC